MPIKEDSSSPSSNITPSTNWKTLSKELGINVEKTKKLVQKELQKPKDQTCYSDLASKIYSLFATNSDKTSNADSLGKYIALDCEFVGIGFQGKDHALARVSIVNYHGKVLYDSYVKPREKIVDYRTKITGITFEHIENAPSFQEVQSKVHALMQGRIVVGHDLKHDFKVLLLSHPRRELRDTVWFGKFRSFAQGQTPSLKKLAEHYLGLFEFQSQSHCSIQDAQVTMLIFRKFRSEWEASLYQKSKRT